MNQVKHYRMILAVVMLFGLFLRCPIVEAAELPGTESEEPVAAEIGAPERLQFFNPKVDTVLLKWKAVEDAEQYYVYMSEKEDTGYQMVCGLEGTDLLLKGLKDKTVYYFKVYAYGNGTISESSEVVSGKTNVRGIDVSRHNGEIDWKQVKQCGWIDFAILRCGYGDNMTEQDDQTFEAHYKACAKWNIPVGVYLYSYADNTAHAQSEADHVLRLIKGKKFPYKVWYDLEDAPTVGTQSPEVIGDMAETFCNSMDKAGYEVGIYANKHWFTTILTDKRFSKWPKWVAQYNDTCTYEGVYIMWQNTSDGSVPGIEGRVDLNYAFTGIHEDLKQVPVYDVAQGLTGKILKPEGVTNMIMGKKSILVQWKEAVGSEQYIVYRSTSPTSGFKKIGTTRDTSYQDDTLVYGKTYYYKVRGINSISTSSYSEITKARLATNTPTALKAETKSYNRIKLTWKSYSDGMGAEVYRSTDASSGYKRIGTTTQGYFVDQKVEIGVQYYYFVRAFRIVNDSGFRLYSNYSEPAIGMSALNPVREPFAVVQNYNTLRLTFLKSQGATSYEIYRSVQKNRGYKKIAETTEGTYTDTTLKTGTVYYYKIRAVCQKNGNAVKSDDSMPVWAKPKLRKPSGVTVVSKQKKTAELNWQSVEGAAGYTIYRCSKQNGTYSKAGQTTNTTFTDKNRKSGMSYYYKIRPYCYVNGKLRYGEWSRVTKATIQ